MCTTVRELINDIYLRFGGVMSPAACNKDAYLVVVSVPAFLVHNEEGALPPELLKFARISGVSQVSLSHF